MLNREEYDELRLLLEAFAFELAKKGYDGVLHIGLSKNFFYRYWFNFNDGHNCDEKNMPDSMMLIMPIGPVKLFWVAETK